jgi:hypothetical protein
MADLTKYHNVFDDQSEFNKLNELVLGAIQEFSSYRQGNLTYGEIMFVMECILDSLRGSAEKDAKTTGNIKGLDEAPTFSTLLGITSRLVEKMVKKGLIGADDEAFILHGDA